MTNLINLYADHVIRGLRTIDSVPTVIRGQVQEIVDKHFQNEEN